MDNAQSKLGFLNKDLSSEEKKEYFYTYFSEMALGHEFVRAKQYALYTEKINNLEKGVFLDIGCGAGEFVQHLCMEGIEAIGIDLSSLEVERANVKGLNVKREDALQFLASNNQSFIGISLLQVIEHITSTDLITILDQCYARLGFGGVIIIETLNIRHPLALNGFYTDPTHQKPIPDNYLSFLVEWVGFKRLELIYNLPEHLAGVSVVDVTRVYTNYTIVAYKD